MTIEIDNADKVFFPEAGYRKGELAEYYRRIAPRMLPHLADRPLTLHRFPDGIDGVNFVQKAVQKHTPDWIARVTVPKEGGRITHALAGDADALAWFVDQGTIDFHIWLARCDKPEHPDRMIFDLDPPGEAAGGDFAIVAEAARTVRGVLDQAGLAAFVMTTGSSGLHIAVPLDRSADFDTVRAFAERVAEHIARGAPARFTTEHRKYKRRGRLYLDTRRNAYAQTGVAPYSVRAKPGAPIATPLAWDELGDGKLTARRFHIGNIFRRLAQRDCPWAAINRYRQSVTKAADRLEKA